MALLSDDDVFGASSKGLMSDADVFGEPTAKPKKNSIARGVADLGLGFVSGAVGATKALADAAGAGSVVSSTLNDVNEGIAGYLSDSAKADQREQSRITQEAEGKGTWEGIKAGAKAFAVAPAQTAVSGLGSVVPVVAGAAATALTGGGAPAALAAGAGIGASMGAGTVKGAIFDEVKKRGIESGMSEADAIAEATKAQEYGGDNAGNIAVGAGLGMADAATGVTKAASNIVRNAIVKPAVTEAAKASGRGIVGRTVAGIAGEMPLEAAQGGQERYAANVAAQRAGYDVDSWAGVASQATLEALASAGPGAAFGAFSGSKYVESKAQPPAEDQQPIAGLLPAPNYTGTPGDQLIANDAERQAAIDAADANAAAVYAAREAFESQLRQSVTIINEPAPLQQRIDDMLNVDASKMNPIQRANYEKTLAAAFSEPIGIRHDANQREVPFTMGEYLDAQVAAENAVRARPLKQNAAQQADARLQQVADEEGYVAPEVPVVGTLSAVANMAIQSGAHKQNQMQQAMQAAVASQKTNNEGTANAAQAKPLAQEATRTNDAQAGLASSAAQAASQGTGVAAPAAFSASVPALNAGNSVNLPATSISSLQDQLDKTEPFSEQSQLLTERLQLAVTDDAKSAIGAGEMPVYKVTDHVSVAIHPSAQKEGMIQVTRYTKDGVIGDSQYNSIDEAVRFEGLTHKPRIPSNEAIAHIENSIAAEAEYQKRKNEQQAGAGLPASTAGGSRPVPVANQEPVKNQSEQPLDMVPAADAVSQPKTDAAPEAKQDNAPVSTLQPDPALQNRDRGRAASVNQMQSIARNPDYMRLGPSRTPDSGAPMVFAVGGDTNKIAPSSFGANDIAVMSDGQRVPFRYAVVDASSVEPSNFADGATNPAFASNAPGTIKALNNGRTAGVRAAHEGSKAANYTAELLADQAHGVSPEAIRNTPNPMLVRVYAEQANTGDMAAKSQGQGLGMSASERATQDAELMTADVLDKFAPGDIASAGNRDFVRAFVGKLAENELADMMDATGNLSQDGRRRIEAALLTAAYGKSDLVQELFESTDTDIKAIGNALKVMSGQWAAMRQAAKEGSIDPATDMTANLIEAVNIVRRSRAEGSSIAELAGQGDLMGGNYLNELSELFLRIFYKGKNYDRARGGDKVIAALHDVVTSAMNTKAEAGLFGDSFKATPKQIVESARSKIDEENKPASQAALFGANGQVAAVSQGNRSEGTAQPGQVGSRPVGTDRSQEAGKQAEPVAKQEAAPASDADARFAKNTIFTADKVAAAKARMKAKLGTMNSGIDPELLIDGMTVAGAYIESGVRKFGDYAKAMIADLGDGVKPYLLSFYEAARAYPGLNKMGMDTAEAAASQHQALLTPTVIEQAKDVVGESPKVEKKKPANLGEAVKLKADWGVEHIDGYTKSKTGANEDMDYGLKGGIKDEFLADAKRYLSAVAKALEAKGYTVKADRKGRPGKAVSVNEAGPAVSGDVYLRMSNGEFDVFAQVGETAVRGMGPEHPQGVSLMVRAALSSNNFAPNNWMDTSLSAGDLVSWFEKQRQAYAQRSTTQPAKEPAANALPDLMTEAGKFAVAKEISNYLIGGDGFKTIIEARKQISEIIGKPIEAATELAKQADETIETAVVMAGREIVKAGRAQNRSNVVIYDRLVDLYRRQPNLAVRSSTSVRDQAYSTPVPLAYLASELAGITYETSVYEPTAGNGMLLVGAAADNVVANELNPKRAAMIRALMPEANVRENNGAEWRPDAKVDAVIANPPFGAVKDGNGETVYFSITPEYTTRELDHAIVFKALESLKDNGRAVLIVGGVQSEAEEARREDYRGKNKRQFYFNLYNNFNVIDHFTADGDLYSKQGASYPVDVIVINGRGKSNRDLPAANLPKIIKSYEELKEKLNVANRMEPAGSDTARTGRSNDQGRGGDAQGLAGSPVGSSEQNGDGGRQRSDSAGVSNAGRSDNEQSAGGRPVSSGGQLESSGTSDGGNGNRVSDKGRAGRSDAGRNAQGNRSNDLGGTSVVDGQRVESGLTDRRGQEQETGHQVSYSPHSNAPAVGTLVPRAMRDAIASSLSKISDQVGDIDNYVAESLDMDPETVRSNFSAEQIDALALSIRNAEAGKGFIIGDQTGIGKGRVVAAMIRYALVNGKTPIFVTEKPNLYSDMIRDLDDIGMTDELGLDTKSPRILITNGGESIPYTLLRNVNGEVVENNLTLRAPKSGKALDDLMQSMVNGDDLGDYKVIFTTYSQLQTVKGKQTTRQRFVNHFGASNYMIFDESHNAGGAGETQARTKEQRQAAKDGQSLVTGRAAFVRGLVQKAFGTFFSSATYAKRPDVMDLYSSTNMKLAVDRISQLGDAIKSGGVPMQQVVANMLTQDGQYIRRERTFAGVDYNTKETVVDQQTAENMASAMRSILAFSRAKEGVIKQMQKEFDKQGAMLAAVGGESTSVQGANFGSIMHNLIDQMLLSLKAKSSVDHAIERLKAGEKVVMTVSNTMGSFLKDYADEFGVMAGDPVALSFSDLYVRYLEKQRIVSIKAGNGEKRQHRLTDAELGPTLVDLFNKVRKQIDESGFGSAPISPIDYMHAELRKAGYKTDEITGRTITLNYQGETPVLASRSANIKQRVGAVSSFNNGDTDVLILNQAGSTGLSLHASSKFKDKRKRHMIIVQAEKNIDTHMQMLGRVHRTGQVIAPAYSQMMADIPAEMRPASVLLKKMASLNANTTASRKSSVTAEGVVDFMNDYGGQVVHEYLRDNPDVLEAVGGPDVMKLTEDSEDGNEDDIRKFTGYVPILPIKMQEEIYRDLIDRYNDLIERENSLGTNKLEAKAVDLDAETLSAQPITEKKEEQSVFASPAVMEKVDVKRSVKPYSSEEVAAIVKERLGDKTARAIASEQKLELRDKASAFARERIAKMQADGADPIKVDMHKSQLNLIYSHTNSILDTYSIGDPVSIKDQNGQFLYGVVTDIQTNGKTANPAAGSAWKMTFAIANGDAKSITMNFSQLGSKYEVRAANIVDWYNIETQSAERVPLMSLFDKGATVRREKRWIITGNLLAGYSRLPGQIITYTKKDGASAQGILMSRQFDFEKEMKNAPVLVKSGAEAVKLFNGIGNGASLGTKDRALMITDRNGRYELTVPSSKKDGGTYFLDQGITDIVGDLYKRGSIMSANVYESDIARLVDYLINERQEVIVATAQPEKAKQILRGEQGPGNIAERQASLSPADKSVYGMVAEGKSAAEVLKFIASASRSPFNRQVAKLLLKTGIAPSVTVGDGKGWKMNAGEGNKYAAGYNPKTDTISLFRPASSERNMLHELIHAATLKALSKKGMASAQMNALYQHVKKSGKLKGMYGMSDVDEFIAEAFSNPKFQAALKQVAAPSTSTAKSAWHWFVRVIKGILGLPSGSENALSQALEIGIGVMRENMRLNEGAGDVRYNAAPGKINQTDTEAFKRWFGDSKVVDSDGNPMRAYHGTGATDINEFKVSERGTYGGGIYLTPDLRGANDYAIYRGAPSSTVYPVYVSIKNPASGSEAAHVASWKGEENAREELIRRGYDGVVDMRSGEIVAFYPSQVKSAIGNNGDFDGANPDIRYNVADEGWSVSEQAKETVMRLAGRPMLDPSDPFAAENARLREQDQSLWSKAKKQLRRYLAPGGLLPQSVFAEKIKRDSEFQAVEFDVRHLIGGLEHAVKADFGIAFDKLSKEQMRPITEALAGNVPASLPEATKTAAVAMRQYIDGMSTEYLKIIQQKIDAKMLKALESGKDSDKAQAINEIELFEKIKGNIGRYVHRSYQAFDDPKWFEKVPAHVLNASRLYLKQGYMEAGENDAKASQMAEVTLHEILKNGTAYDSMESFIAESKLGAKDLSVLMRRKEVPAQIRALLGEYPDARLNFTKSATKMGRLIWNTRFLDRVRDMGMGSFFFEGKDRPPNATTQIAADGSEVYAPLNGLWTFPETAQAFKDALGKEQMSDLYRAIVRANGLVKYGKTVLAPTTAMRNWQSAMFFSLANGHFDLTQMKKSISAFREQVSQKATGQDLKYLRHLKQLGVVYDTPYAGEMARLMEDARMEELLSSDKGDAVRWFRKANQLAQGFYTFGDDFWKIIGFENEKAGLMKAGLSLQEAEIEAAKRIRDTYPTYSMVGRGIQWLSRFPLAGTFVSFPAEIIRTSGNMLRTVAADLKSDNPKLRELGMKRAAGMVFVSAAFYSLAALSMAMAGVGDDEDEAIRDLAPEWQKNSTFLYLGRDEKGNLRYFDMSFLDPYGYWKRPITAMLRNQPWEDSLASGLRGMLEPFIGADIAAKAIFEAVANQKENGGKVYKEKDGAINQTIDVADHLRKALQPGVVGNVERLVKAAGDVRKSSGQPYSMEDELVALVGWRATTIDPKTALYYRSFEFTDAVAEARKTITETLRDANEITPEDIADAKARAQAKQEQAFKEMHRLVSAAESAGMSKMQIVQTLRLSNISQANIGSLMRGETPDVSITPQLAARAVRQASQMRGPEYAAEVFDRYRQARAN